VVVPRCAAYSDREPLKAEPSVRLLACGLGLGFPTCGGMTPLDPPEPALRWPPYYRPLTGHKARFAGPVRPARRSPLLGSLKPLMPKVWD
jgi:hypothetical protein